MSKLIHAEGFETAVGSRACTTVREIETPDGPVREIEINAHADLTPAEARRLIAALKRAVALAEEQPAVSEDQPKPREPRVWHKGDEEPPADVTELLTAAGNRVVRVPGGWCMPHCHPDGDQRLCSPALASDWEGVTVWDNPLSEVLADSEQVPR